MTDDEFRWMLERLAARLDRIERMLQIGEEPAAPPPPPAPPPAPPPPPPAAPPPAAPPTAPPTAPLVQPPHPRSSAARQG
ncbi:MAG: hypothetical protein ACYTAU_17115, partial [Planctomycetota bacterium]